MTNDGSMMWLDDHGNVRGGVPSPYVNVPVAQYAVRNEGAKPYPQNLHPWADRGENGIQALCRLAGYQMAFTQDSLRALYGSKADYRRKVEQAMDDVDARRLVPSGLPGRRARRRRDGRLLTTIASWRCSREIPFPLLSYPGIARLHLT